MRLTSARIFCGLQTSHQQMMRDLRLTPQKHKFKSDLAEKKQQLSKSRKLSEKRKN